MSEPRTIEGFLLLPETRDALLAYLVTQPYAQVKDAITVIENLAPLKVTVIDAPAEPGHEHRANGAVEIPA
jgi:hypothetical protein